MEAENAYSLLTPKKTSTISSKQQNCSSPELNCVKTQAWNFRSRFCLEYISTKVTSLMSTSIKTTYGHCGHPHLNFWHPRLEEKKSTLRHPPQEIRALRTFHNQYLFNTTSSRKLTSPKQRLLKQMQLSQPKQKPSLANPKQTAWITPSPAAQLPTQSKPSQLTLTETHKQQLPLNN